ncbi:MAG: hypothetical protein LBC73_10900 [Oscillospiraceae bacterium]|jgi:hypothetical protein|nr:hypothetical protein [Oscillospiraceae bacterium]
MLKKFISLFTVQNVLIILVFAVVLINVLEFQEMDNRAPLRFKAFYRYPSDMDIYEIAFWEVPVHRSRHEYAYDLGKVSDNANLITPPHGLHLGEWINPFRYFVFLGNIKSFEWLEYDPHSFLDDFDPTPYIIPPTYEDSRHRIALNSEHTQATEFITLWWHGYIVIFIDTSLLPDYMYERIEMLRR